MHQIDMTIRYGTLAESKEIYLKSYRIKKKKKKKRVIGSFPCIRKKYV